MNDHLPPVFRDILNRQFAALYPVEREPDKRTDNDLMDEIDAAAKHNEFLTDDRLAELVRNLHMKEPGL